MLEALLTVRRYADRKMRVRMTLESKGAVDAFDCLKAVEIGDCVNTHRVVSHWGNFREL